MTLKFGGSYSARVCPAQEINAPQRGGRRPAIDLALDLALD